MCVRSCPASTGAAAAAAGLELMGTGSGRGTNCGQNRNLRRGSRPMNCNAFLRVARVAGALAFAAGALGVAAQPAPTSEWPKGPVHIVVPYGPGSTPDIIARIVGDRLAK